MEKEVSFKDRLKSLGLAIRWSYTSSKYLCIILVLVGILSSVLTLVEPYIFKLIIDYLVNHEAMTSNQKISIAIFGLLAIYGLARILQSIFWDINNSLRRTSNIRIEKHVMHEMMSNISSLDLTYFENPEYYNTLTKATSSLWRITEVFWQISYFFSEFISVILIISALAVFDFRLFLIVLLGAIPSIFVALKWGEFTWSAFDQYSPIQRHAHYYKNLLTENPEAIKEIRSFGLREHFLNKFRNLFTFFIKKQDKATIKEFKWYVIIALVEGSLSVFAALLVINLFMKGQITLGDLTFLWALLFQFATHVRWMVRMIGDINTHSLFITPILKVIKFRPKILQSFNPKKFPSRIKKGIEFKNVTFYYSNSKKPALKNVSFFIKPEESVALVGENGSGKTTLIKLLSRLYDVSSGEILIDGINIKEYFLDDLYNNIGVIFQDFMRYEALIEENIRFGRLSTKNYFSKVHSSSVKSGAYDFIKDLEKKYKTPLGKKIYDEGQELSVGQWQKIALARAFFRDANILVLDEPTSAVDAKAEYQLFQKFEHLTKNKITFLISHRFSTVRMAHKILVINKGKLIEEGSHKQLLKNKGIYSKMFRLQAEGYK